MSYSPLITKSDFSDYVKIGANLKDEAFDIHIRAAQENELLNWVSDAFYLDITGDLTSKPQLLALYTDYIKPYMVYSAYYEFLLWHGRNVSQFGLRVNNEDTSTDIGDRARAELLGDVLGKKNARLNRLKRKLEDDNFTYDGVVYDFYNEDFKVKPSNNIGMFQVGKNKRKYYDRKKGCCDE